MDNLTIAHLAPYLPYGLKYMNVKNNEITTMKALDSDVEMVDWGWGCALEFHELKPILRPLSDLQNKELDFWIDFGTEIDEMNVDHLIDALVNGTYYAKNIHNSLSIWNALFKMHFDVFNLRSKNLCIYYDELK
jgi:hypothetical protein